MENISAKLVIVGSGPLEKKLKQQASEKKADIVFYGSKSHEELKEIYASADVFVAPSITANDGDQEGFGLVLLEAMASGLPVVTSESGGITQFVFNNVNGLLVKEKDVKGLSENINKILEDEVLRKKIIENGYKTANEYDYKNIGLKYKNIIDKILKEGNGNGY